MKTVFINPRTFLLLYNQCVEGARKHLGHVICRRQHCSGCSAVLAIEITDKLGTRGEYYVVKDTLKTRRGIDLLYGKEVWFGNWVRCPCCGREGRLPIDKPLSAEMIAQPKEVASAAG